MTLTVEILCTVGVSAVVTIFFQLYLLYKNKKSSKDNKGK